VVRNGHHQPREVTTSAGAVPVRAPRINDKRADEVTGVRRRFCSAILPAWSRKSPKVTEVLPLLYLHGLSSQDFVPALEGFLGSGAGLSAATITRLTAQWQGEAKAFGDRDLSAVDYVYVRADGVHVGVRLKEERLCLLVLIGVRADGTKELITLADGLRLNALPKSAQPGAKRALAEIWNAEDKDHAREAVQAFAAAYGAKFPTAVAKISGDVEALLAFYDFPAEHWIHLRTTNPIWVFDSAGQPGRCFPGWCSSWPALTLNPIDAVRLSWTRSVGPAA
jgi:transposase-like protein